MENLNNIIEAIMFALGREISIEEIAKTLEVEEQKVQESIENLKEKYNDEKGVKLIHVNGMVQLVTNNKYYDYVSKFVENTKRQNLSVSAQETLAIIAYNPKITKTEIEAQVAMLRRLYEDQLYDVPENCNILLDESALTNLVTGKKFKNKYQKELKSLEKVVESPDDTYILYLDYVDDSSGNLNINLKSDINKKYAKFKLTVENGEISYMQNGNTRRITSYVEE